MEFSSILISKMDRKIFMKLAKNMQVGFAKWLHKIYSF